MAAKKKPLEGRPAQLGDQKVTISKMELPPERAAGRIVGDPRAVVGLDPSMGMLGQARKRVDGPLVQGQVEDLPFGAARFDALTIGYALRHAADLDVAFAECLRVLKPGGRILVLEISRPASRRQRWLLRTYFMKVLPAIMALGTRNRHAAMLSRYYWETIDECVAPEAIMDALRGSGFVDVRRRVLAGMMSEYTGTRRIPDDPSADGHRLRRDSPKAIAAQDP
jgi:demethylmenaquinone methyltransferase/2-methoxy-6-polyprenyl-1,4-benzoquinol methylase